MAGWKKGHSAGRVQTGISHQEDDEEMKRIPIVLLVGMLMLVFVYSGVAAARPIWIWGLPWPGDYSEKALEKANEWALEKFGATFKLSGAPGGVPRLQGLDTVLSKGQFPDVIILSGGLQDKLAMVSFAKAGKIMPLDKYFNDPKNYPHLAKGDRHFLKAYSYNGKIYALPGFTWPVEAGSPPWLVHSVFGVRTDIHDELGVPKTDEEFLEFLRKIKRGAQAGKYISLTGRPVIPFGVEPDPKSNRWIDLAYLFKGAGWEVDGKKRLMPPWASVEFHDSLQFLNQLWQEGLMSPAAFSMDVNTWNEGDSGAVWGGYAVTYTTGGQVKRGWEVIPKAEGRFGKESAEAKLAKARTMMPFPHPIVSDGKLGRLMSGGYGASSPVVLISAKTPNPDAVMKLVDFMLSDEGLIMYMFGAGKLGVDWNWAPKPLLWEGTGERKGKQKAIPGGRGVEASPQAAEKTPPEVLPGLLFVTSPNYPNYMPRLMYQSARQQKEDFDYRQMDKPYGVPGGGGSGVELEPVARAIAPLVTERPSYLMVVASVPPQEVSAMATAEQRLQQGIAGVITAGDAKEFDAKYKSLLDTMIRVTNWKPLYEAKQERWLDWLEDNGFDDRAQLRTVTPRPEWNKVMGW